MSPGVDPRVEAELTWLHGYGSATLGGQSWMGPMLDHAELYYTPCDEAHRARVREVTVWPTPRKRHTEAHEPNDHAISRFTRIVEKLRDADARMPGASRVLAEYFGEPGDRFSRLTEGRIVALYPLTTAGQKLMQKQRAKAAGERAASLDGATNQLALMARSQAWALLAAAVHAYQHRHSHSEAAE